MVERISTFFKESRDEWRHVNWPTREEGIYLTMIVIGFSLVLAVFLGLFDYIFYYLLRVYIIKA